MNKNHCHYILPPKVLIQKLNIAPDPTAIDIAIRKASAALVNPAKKSPAIVSLIAFVIASPGTRSIIAPIIVLSILILNPNITKSNVSEAAVAPPIQLIKNSFIDSFWNFIVTIFIIKPIKVAAKRSLKPPPKSMENVPAASAEKANVRGIEYLSPLSISFSSFKIWL